MTATRSKGDQGRSLRERAEAQTRRMEADALPRSAAESDALLHELRVHQIELEMQNEELRRAQLALDISRARYFDLYDLAPVGYVTVSAEGKIVEANLRASAMLLTPRDELMNMSLSRFIVAAQQDSYYLHRRGVRPGGDVQVCELRMKQRDGTEFWARLESVAADSEGSEQGTIRTTISDINEIRRLRDNAALSDRMASIGMLAASVAHEINNPLTYVLYNVANLVEALPPTAAAVERCRAVLLARVGDGDFAEIVGEQVGLLDAEKLADLIDSATQAAAGLHHLEEIARGLSFFSRAEPDGLVLVDVNEAAEHAIHVAAHEVRSRAQMTVELGLVPRILASDGRLAQAFLNLIVNAAHAIDEGDAEHNRITVRTWADGKGHVCASVEDTGCGIPAEQQDRIFEPFFTTKGPERGTGLGLAITQRIVTAFGGEIHFESVAGRGSRFELRFPMGGSHEVAPPRVPVVATPDAPGRVLLVDDERLVRTATARILRGICEVVSVGSVAEAIELLDAGEEFDAILCDLMMPVMSGIEFHAWLIDHYPQQVPKVVFVTGGVFTPRTQDYLASVSNTRLEKPIKIDALRQLVTEMVRAPRGGLH